MLFLPPLLFVLCSCYAYGWSPEVAVAHDGAYRHLKW
jgi:hypothetical protein